MLNILLMIILLIIIFIFIILLFGIRLTARWVKVDSDCDGCLEILILKKLKVYTFDFKSDDDDEDSDEEKEHMDPKKLYELAKPCFEYIKRFIEDFFNAVSINKLENHLIIGFSSFANTGMYIGYIWAISSIVNSSIPNAHLKAEPSFSGTVLNVKGSMNIDISILKLIIPAIRLLSKKEIRTLISGVRNG